MKVKAEEVDAGIEIGGEAYPSCLLIFLAFTVVREESAIARWIFWQLCSNDQRNVPSYQCRPVLRRGSSP